MEFGDLVRLWGWKSRYDTNIFSGRNIRLYRKSWLKSRKSCRPKSDGLWFLYHRTSRIFVAIIWTIHLFSTYVDYGNEASRFSLLLSRYHDDFSQTLPRGKIKFTWSTKMDIGEFCQFCLRFLQPNIPQIPSSKMCNIFKTGLQSVPT